MGLGYSPDPVVGELESLGSRSEDVVVLYVEELVDSVVEAYEAVRTHCTSRGRGVVHLIRLDAGSLYENVATVLESLRMCEGKELVLSARGPVGPVLLVKWVLDLLGRGYTLRTEMRGSPLSLPWDRSGVRMVGLDRRILQALLYKENIESDEIALMLNVKPKTVRNRLSSLRRWGLLVRKRGRYRLTDMGKAIALVESRRLDVG